MMIDEEVRENKMGETTLKHPRMSTDDAEFARKERHVLYTIDKSLAARLGNMHWKVADHHFLHPFYIGAMNTGCNNSHILTIGWIGKVDVSEVGVAMDKYGFSIITSPHKKNIFDYEVSDFLMLKIYVDGLQTAGVLHGDAVFEGIRVKNDRDIIARGNYTVKDSEGPFLLRKSPLTQFEYDMARSSYHDLIDALVQSEQK